MDGEVFTDLEALPADCERLFAAQTHFQSSRAWYKTVGRTAMPPGAAMCLLLCRQASWPVALVPLQILQDGKLQSLTTPYTTLYQPLIAPGADADDLRQAGRVVGRFCRRWGTTRIDALDAAWRGLVPLLAGFRQAGLLVQRFDHFGNWYVRVEGLSWNSYLAARPGALRTTVRRKLGRAERDRRISFELTHAPAAAAATLAYEDVYGRSWKEPEPFPRFNAALLQAAAAIGALRLGVLRHDGRPVAAQYWIVDHGCATVLKLAHDKVFAPLSPGTVLTAMMIRRLLDEEHVAELDFGRGDDAYKELWTDRRRQRIGILLANPLRVSGLVSVVRHLLGRGRQALRPGR